MTPVNTGIAHFVICSWGCPALGTLKPSSSNPWPRIESESFQQAVPVNHITKPAAG